MSQGINPHDLKDWIRLTSWQFVEDLQVYKLATELHGKIVEAWSAISDRPRFHSLYDQLYRSSSSVVLNLGESVGKGKGYFANAAMIARGELYECCAGLAVAEPKEVYRPLIPLAKKCIDAMNEFILATELDKP